MDVLEVYFGGWTNNVCWWFMSREVGEVNNGKGELGMSTVFGLRGWVNYNIVYYVGEDLVEIVICSIRLEFIFYMTWIV